MKTGVSGAMALISSSVGPRRSANCSSFQPPKPGRPGVKEVKEARQAEVPPALGAREPHPACRARLRLRREEGGEGEESGAGGASPDVEELGPVVEHFAGFEEVGEFIDFEEAGGEDRHGGGEGE